MARAFVLLVALSVQAVLAAVPARADHLPVIAVPTRPGVPIVINGRDASYAVVEGDWGLARPGHGTVTVIGGSPLTPNVVYTPRSPYHPRYGAPPPRGRYEVEPPPDRPLPQPAESFSRFWSTSSDMRPPRAPPQPYRWPQANHDDVDMAPPAINDPQPFDPPPNTGRRDRRR